MGQRTTNDAIDDVGRDSGEEEVIQLLVALVFSINHHLFKNEQVYNSVPSTGGDIRDILEILCELEVGRMHARAGLEILVSPVVFCLSTFYLPCYRYFPCWSCSVSKTQGKTAEN
jgi:hypothetical protein